MISALMNRKIKDVDLRSLMPPSVVSIDGLRKKAGETPGLMSDNEWKKLIKDELSLKARSQDELCALFGLSLAAVTRLLISLEASGELTLSDGKYILTIV
ncbi:MAG: hypothetical protein J5657_01535 [Clostridiales bacterium]|nr:hypothetical protein [Clostridiales bacterium]